MRSVYNGTPHCGAARHGMNMAWAVQVQHQHLLNNAAQRT